MTSVADARCFDSTMHLFAREGPSSPRGFIYVSRVVESGWPPTVSADVSTMSPNQRQNPDPYQDKRPPERQPRQGPAPQPTGGPQQGPQRGAQQGPPPEQFRGQQSPQQGPAPQQGSPPQQGSAPQQSPMSQQQPPQGVRQQPAQQQQGVAPGTIATNRQAPPQQQPAAGMQSAGRGPQLHSAPIDEVLESDVVTVTRDTPITEVVQALGSEDVGSVVVTEDDRPVGIVTDRKIALALGDTADLSDRTAGDLLSGDLVTGTAEMTVFDVLRQLDDEDIRRLPIVDDDGALEGIVTLDDVIVLLSAELSDVASVIKGQSRRF